MLEIQKYLRAGGTLESLKQDPYNLFVKEDDNLVLLKYNQISSDFNEPICIECRGIILEKNTWNVVCFPFIKFFNYGEPFAAKVISDFHVYQKIDGSLAKVWYYAGEWHLSSNSVINAKEVEIKEGVNFYNLFIRALQTYNLTWNTFTSALDPNYTYMYELATPDNQVVIKYEKYSLYYLGQRNIHTFKEKYEPDTRIDNVKVYDFHSINAVIEDANFLPDDEEGYVVRDRLWNRIKVKNPKYFMLHHLANNGKPDILQYILNNNTDELLTYFPDYKDEINKVRLKLMILENNAEYYKTLISQYWSSPRKEFALQVTAQVPKYLQPFIFKTYERHWLDWQDFTSDWDIYKLRNIMTLASEQGELNYGE